MTYYTELFCEECKSAISMKDSPKWISLKCKCRCAIYYANGYFTIIPKKVYMKNKEREVEKSDL